ncbi:MAG: hypothetical protein HC825_02375 [Oscillatoriales cyanobacterium RM1_1_9]|nr:hypothetical protein [Oscillatoriales cyanobacterium RM1_1_9]
MFNRILNFLVDQAWPFAKPFVEVIFPEYKPVINLVDKVVTPWLDQLLEDFEVTIDGSSLIDVTKILNEPDVLKEYQALTQRSADSSKLYLLTENTDILAPTGMPSPSQQRERFKPNGQRTIPEESWPWGEMIF